MTYKKFCTTLVIALGVCACDGLSSDDYLLSSRYATYDDAVTSGVFQLGWLPKNIPESAHRIVEYHNLDTNELFVKFDYEDDDIQDFIKTCDSGAYTYPSARKVKNITSWWPRELTEVSPDGEKFETYKCSNMPHAGSRMEASIAIDLMQNRAWYWVLN